MGIGFTDNKHYTSIAERIRALRGVTDTTKPAEMPTALDTFKADVDEELELLFSENDPDRLAEQKALSIAARIRLARVYKGSIMNAIQDKGVDVPTNPPFRTLFTLIDQIEQGSDIPTVTSIDYSTLDSGAFSETLEDGTVVNYSVEQTDGQVTSISDGTNTVSVDWGT